MDIIHLHFQFFGQKIRIKLLLGWLRICTPDKKFVIFMGLVVVNKRSRLVRELLFKLSFCALAISKNLRSLLTFYVNGDLLHTKFTIYGIHENT